MVALIGACEVTAGPGPGLSALGCPSAAARRDALQRLAELDARHPDVRALALRLVARLPVLDPGSTGPELWRAVVGRVRYVGEVRPDLWSHALTTWRTAAGDCDDSARLLVALAVALGLQAQIVTIDRPDGSGHASVRIWDGSSWRWADPSIPGSRWGEAPEAAYARAGSMWPGRGGVSRETGLGALAPERHREVRALVLEAFRALGISAPLGAVQAVQAVALGESTYGRGWSGPMADSHNMGAITAGSSKLPCPAGSAPNKDHNADGSEYVTCFRTYPDEQAGMTDLVRFIYANKLRRAAFADPRSADEIGEAMIASVYAVQRGPSCKARPGASEAERRAALASAACRAERVEAETSAIHGAAATIARALGEPLILVRSPRPSVGAWAAVGVVGVGAVAGLWWLRRRRGSR